ncbi:MAG: hypothetical protein ACQES1_07270 [Bacteroidota bacterium]
MKRHKFWIFINSLLAFISAYIFVKAVIILVRFVIIRFFDGDLQLTNFEMECVSPPYSNIWTSFSVKTIYLSGFLISGILIPVAYGFYKRFQSEKGLVKLWFVWVYVIAISQSFGVFIRDIPFSRDIYHALHWTYISYGGMLGFIVVSLPALFFLNYMNIIRFMKMAPSSEYLKTTALKRKFYNRIALLPALFGSLLIIAINYKTLQAFEVVEKLVILLCVAIPYLHFLKKKLELNFLRVKNDTTDQFNPFVLLAFLFAVIGYYVIKTIYF